MSIIPLVLLQNELPSDAVNSNNELTYAIAQATNFCNNWAYKYDPFDDYDTDDDTTRAPDQIVRICLEMAKIYYWETVGEVTRDGDNYQIMQNEIENYQKKLQEIQISPSWEEQAISLDTNYCMLVGSRTNTGGMWPRVIPQTAQVIDGYNVWVRPDHWTIRKGGTYSGEYPDAWYLEVSSSYSVAGTLRYMRTYRNDSIDYARYQ